MGRRTNFHWGDSEFADSVTVVLCEVDSLSQSVGVLNYADAGKSECARNAASPAEFTDFDVPPWILGSIVLTVKRLVHGLPTCTNSGMRRLLNTNTKLASMFVAAGLILSAQERNPTQKPPAQAPQGQTATPAPLYRVEVVERTTPAVNYLHRSGSSKIDFNGTPLMPSGKGSAKVESQRGVIQVSAEFKGMVAPSSFGPEYLTYVLWAISPDGRPVNLGELTLNDYGNGSSSKIDATSDIQTFGLIVTAEPCYGVTQPTRLPGTPLKVSDSRPS